MSNQIRVSCLIKRQTFLASSGMNTRLYYWSLVAAISGFLFGFDTVLISSAEKRIQSVWQLNDLERGHAMSIALWGPVVGFFWGMLAHKSLQTSQDPARHRFPLSGVASPQLSRRCKSPRSLRQSDIVLHNDNHVPNRSSLTLK